MILAVDVHYCDNVAVAAGVSFDVWSAKKASAEYLHQIEGVEAYQPGEFYKRELPCILGLLQAYDLRPSIIVVDGYVYLDGVSKPGLGKRLYDELYQITDQPPMDEVINQKVEIIGVAKKAFLGIDRTFEIYRGDSAKPLYVTSTLSDIEQAKQHILNMSGAHRIPTLLKRVDQICRQGASSVSGSTAL